MPVVTANANPDTICAGNHTVLTASGAATYTWSDNLGSNTSVTVFPAASVTYTVVGYNILNCSDTAEISVVVLPTPLPVITATALPDSICSGDTTILTANGGTSYLWSDNLGATASVNAAPLANTTYTVTATANNGCYNTASVSVFVNPLPQAQANNTGPYCEGDTVYFQAQGGASYLWSGPLGFNSNNANAVILNSTIAMSGLYVVTVTSDMDCEDTAQTHLSVNALPLAVANASNTQICLGDMDTLTATGGSQYIWSTNQNTPQIIVSPSASQSYTVTVNNGYCSNTASLYITVNPLPNANAGNDTTVNSGTPFNLSGNGGTSYQWFPDTYLSSITAQNPVCVPSQSIQYVLTVYNAFGCTNTDTVNITVIDADCGEVFVPNAFSPNNDGINDEFIIHGNCIESVKVSIYNQWGTKVFEGINSSVLWNGYFEEQPAPAGVYSYYIVYVTNTNLTKTIKGNLVLMN